MKKFSVFAIAILLLAITISPQSAKAATTTLYVDVDAANSCGGNTPCYLHPQDAVNAASSGDTILVYPGIYGSRYFVCDPVHPAWCAPNDNWAPALIVYKDGLTIKSVDGPATTIIQSTHNFWSNAIAVQNSTAGAITGISSWSPNAITIVANDVTIDGFTLHRPFEGTWATKNTAGVFIGSKAAGYADFLGQANGATVQNNTFSDVWHAVYIWHSSDNKILNNTVTALTTDHWAAISTYDGYDDAGINLGNLSENNVIAFNTLANKGIALGAWAPPTWTSAAEDVVACNTTTLVGVTYAHGPVLAGGNTGGFWQSNTDGVLNITGISYTGDTLVPFGTPINLSAQLTYAGSGDGSGVDVMFTLDGTAYTTATTVAGGLASTTATLPVGVYEIGVNVEIYPGCTVTSGTQFLVVYDATAGFVTGGGWINSPADAYTPDPTLTGKATFGFVSKYQKGANLPTGNTEFQFKVANLNFKSTSYQWLVIAGSKAQFKGTGTINGMGEYGFMLTATDGSPDKFRIKIWDKATGEVIYDNMLGEADGVNPATALGGGSIVIHK